MDDSVISFEITRLEEASLRFHLTDALDVDGDEIQDFDTIAIDLYDANDTLIEAGTVVSNPSDANSFYADFELPSVTRLRQYYVKISGTKNGVNIRKLGIVWVHPF